MSADVLVVGGGPVGLAAAIEARLVGMSVVVAEPRESPIDKACGEGLMPGALPLLDHLGVHPAGVPFHGISYRDGKRIVDHRFETGTGLGVRRTTLQGALHERAVELGVEFERVKVDVVEQDDTGVTAGGIRASWMLACDGLHSTVARATGLALAAPRSRRRYGLRRHYRVAPWNDMVEVHWTKLGELYVTPTGDGLVGIALLAPQHTDFERALASSPYIFDRIAGCEHASELRGAGPFRQNTRARVSGRVLLVGDASGYVDAITGEGLRLGFDQARAAIDAIEAEQPRAYESEWARITRDFRRLTNGLAFVASSPARGAVVPLAGMLPRVYRNAVEALAR